MIEVPYPADLEAKGWSLSLDYEKIEQSDTWAVAAPEQRPWLLMLWMTSWRQVPVASLPDNDKLIAVRIGMPVEQFTAWREILLSGWEEATDGRLYHKTLTQHVLVMAEKRAKDRKRVADFRAKSALLGASNSEQEASNDDVTRYTNVTSELPTRDQRVSSTPIPIPIPNIKPKQDKSCLSAEPPDYALENSDEPETTDTGNPIPNVPHAEIIEAYNEILATQGLTAVKLKLWDKSERAKWLRTRWREDPGRQNLDWWRGFFQYVSRSDFLMGRVRSDRPWQADLGWLLKRENFVKVLEGKYDA